MSKRLAALLFVFLPLASALGSVAEVKDLPDGEQLKLTDGTLRLQVWNDDVVRVTFAHGDQLPAIKSLTVLGEPVKTAFTRQDSADSFTIQTSRLSVRVNKSTGAVSFLDSSGKSILAESVDGRSMEPAKDPRITGDSCSQSFQLPNDEGLYGLGQHQQGVWNYPSADEKHRAVQLAQVNMEVGIPVISSSKGYLLLWDNPAITTITPTPGDNGTIRWSSEFGRAIDYYFCYDDGTLPSAMKAYRNLTGNAPLMPKWMLGFWQCKERYASQAELLDVARKYREMKVPLDGIIQDWQYWPPGNTWGSHQFDPKRYPDPVALFKQLHEMHVHSLISVWAKFDVGSDNSKELNATGGMYTDLVKFVYPPGQGQWYDPFNPKGREVYWRQMKDEIFSKGVDGWWLDASEPELPKMVFRTYTTGAGPGYQVYNAYPLMHTAAVYQGQRAATNDKRVVILTRSAYAGEQRNSAIVWSGDIRGTWDVLRNQVPAGLNISMSGIPYWNTDTGGFFGDKSAGNLDPTNPKYQELFTRWFQFSAFCPMFRVHGSYGLKPGKEIYRFDEKTQGIMRTYLDLRYRLLPYLYSTAWDVTSNGSTFMRPLVMDFAGDPQTPGIGNEYLFGPSILVTPVTTPGAATQSVYLPSGAAWTNFWTGASVAAGQRTDATAPVETLPLFIRPGSILPMGPLLQYSGEKPADPIELRVYPGANGSFTLYEDQGDSYRYETGAFATISLTWNDATKTLTIGKRQGEFPGMLKDRTFNIVLVREGHGSGVGIVDAPDQVVKYNGDKSALVVSSGK